MLRSRCACRPRCDDGRALGAYGPPFAQHITQPEPWGAFQCWLLHVVQPACIFVPTSPSARLHASACLPALCPAHRPGCLPRSAVAQACGTNHSSLPGSTTDYQHSEPRTGVPMSTAKPCPAVKGGSASGVDTVLYCCQQSVLCLVLAVAAAAAAAARFWPARHRPRARMLPLRLFLIPMIRTTHF